MYNFHLYGRDEEFDLLRGTLSGTLFTLLGDQLERARAVLSIRSRDEVAYALDSLDWMLRQGSQRLFEETEQVLARQNYHFISRVKALRAFMPHIDIASQSRLPNARWADYFAALAIAYAAEARYAAKEEPRHREKFEPLLREISPEAFKAPPSGTVSNLDCDQALEAMDAVCYAEHLATQKEAQPAPISDAAELGRKGGLIRTAKYSGLNDKVIGLYRSDYHTSPSNRAAAKQIFSVLSEEDLHVLNTDDPIKRFEKWIGEHKRRETDKLMQKFLYPID